MSTTSHEEWLAALKPGDQVVVRAGVGYGSHKVQTVVKVPTTERGRFTLDDGTQFRADGIEWAKTSVIWSRDTMVEATPELLEHIKHEKLVSAVYGAINKLENRTAVRALSNERLEELLAVLTKHSKEKNG